MTAEQSQQTEMNVKGMSDEMLSWGMELALRGVTENAPQSPMYEYSLTVGAEMAAEQARRRNV